MFEAGFVEKMDESLIGELLWDRHANADAQDIIKVDIQLITCYLRVGNYYTDMTSLNTWIFRATCLLISVYSYVWHSGVS